MLTEGEFQNTYKFALLIALARWSLENPDHDEDQPLDVRALAEHFTELYWPHVRPFAGNASAVAEQRPPYASGSSDTWQGVLIQDRGQKNDHQIPRVLKRIRSVQSSGAWRFDQLDPGQRESLLREVVKSIQEMPLWRLHRVRDSSEPVRFLYREGPSQHEILFEDGIVACLVFFAPLVEEVVRSAWLRFVLRCNPQVLGAVSQVETFLFPESRGSLDAWRSPLQEVQRDICFYCNKEMRSIAVVDHFVPWSRYPRDLGHNFVLAHAECNQHKSDHLASCEHLQRWCKRNDEHGAQLAQRFDAARLPHDWPVLRRVAGSLYRIAEAADAQVWRRASELVHLDAKWRQVLGA